MTDSVPEHLQHVLGNWSWNGNSGEPVHITYSFDMAQSNTGLMAHARDYVKEKTGSELDENSAPLNADQRAAVERIFRNISDTTAITFEEVEANPKLVLRKAGLSSLGFAGVVAMIDQNGEMITDDPQEHKTLQYAEVILNDDFFLHQVGKAATLGNYYEEGAGGAAYTKHELMHVFGIKHPDERAIDYKHVGENLDLALTPSLLNHEVHPLFTFAHYDLGAAAESLVGWPYPNSLGKDDMAALQHIYGKNEATGKGNDVYRFDKETNTTVIYDAGGEDVIDTTALSDVAAKIDLRDSRNFNIVIGGTAQYHNIASASQIENVQTGDNHDHIKGNDADNRIESGGGHDVVDGGAGNDTLIAGNGKNMLTGGAGADAFVVQPKAKSETKWTRHTPGGAGAMVGLKFANLSKEIHVTDFSPEQGDTLRMEGVEGITSFEDIKALRDKGGIQQIGQQLQMSLADGQKVMLDNVGIDDLKAEMFTFASAGAPNKGKNL